MATHTESISQLVTPHLTSIPGDLKDKFCKLWPDIKKGLELLKDIVKHVPPLAFLAPIIDTTITLGDGLQKAICK